MRTPWGESQYSEQIADGITFYGTATHGGIRLSRERRKHLPEYMPEGNRDTEAGWFEEDCDWAIPAVFYAEEFAAYDARRAKEQFLSAKSKIEATRAIADERLRDIGLCTEAYDPDLLSAINSGADADTYADRVAARKAESARDTLRNWRPELYERFFNITLKPGQSFIRDEQLFKEQHRNDWVVISAISPGGPCGAGIPVGMVKVAATRGGARTPGIEERSFLVPAVEYDGRGPHGFVIDPSRHRPLDERSPRAEHTDQPAEGPMRR